MPLTPFAVAGFGGLNLLDDPTDVGMSGAVDMLNVALNVRGALRTRDGYTDITNATPVADFYTALIPLSRGQILAVGEDVGGGTGVTYDTCTALGLTHRVTDAVSTTPNQWASLSAGTSSTVVYLAQRDASAATLKKYTWPANTLAASTGKPSYVGTLPFENRLAQSCYQAAADTPSGANGTTSTVFFSDPGAPDTYPSTNWIELGVGDGEDIVAMASWQNFLFVFKPSTLFIFYGTSTLSDGSPEFLYRRVSLPEPLVYNQVRPIAGPDGLYYLTPGGIYATNGGAPFPVSNAVRPVFDRSASSALAMAADDAVLGGVVRCLSWIGQRLILNYKTVAGTQRQLIWDRATNTWWVWGLPTTSNFVHGLPGLTEEDQPNSMYFGGSEAGVGRIYRFGLGATDDDGAATSWAYQTGASDAGGYNRARITGAPVRKNHFAVDILGGATGSITHQVIATNGRPNDVADPGGTLALGTYPATARGHRRRGARGTHFAHRLSGTGPATINGLTYWLSAIEGDT